MYGAVQTASSKVDTELLSGLALIVLAATSQASQQCLAKRIEALRLPYSYMTAAACVVCILILIGMIEQSNLPEKRHWGWLFLRGLLGGCRMVTGILAVLCGISIGDAAALSSVNGLAGAIMGFLFLGESLTWVHFAAALGTMCGAVLITSPSFVWSKTEHESTTMILFGSAMATMSGVLQACQFSVARKLKEVDAEYQSISAIFFSGVVMFMVKIPLFPEGHRLQVMVSLPLTSFVYFFCVSVTMILSSLLGSRGSSRLPVALSTTTHIGTRMIIGYTADAILFRTPVGLFEVLGGTLMVACAWVIASVSSTRPPQQDSEKVVKPVGSHTA